ncbi:L-type lectin-domain containing receptor kinase IV.4 [Raphanus sativus]|uniref:non-specific serine/threonine protein kinase n=1 Tax=Raphanus sativus TaxID=3726 RepID=A0A6J0L928_RAPSA|nr:L-type lectin-domain containing receptor kinase IV.4-like [Raphanus sativus]KAJ4876592.1 L-type lectin-domain containing receptor kinase IV.4 [Raphanus sativus]
MFAKLLTIVFFVILVSQLLKSSSQFLDNFTYNGFHPPLNLISLQGIARVTPTGLLELTNSTSHQTGHAFYTQPIRFKDSPNDTVSSFSTTFVFAIHSQIPTLGGDGITFVVAPTSSLPFVRSGAQYLGLFNRTNNGNETNNIFAVELDTIQNKEFNDTNDNHVGIDINSLKSVKSSPAGYWDEKSQFKNLTLISGKPMQVWVEYDGLTHQINVTMAPFNHDKPIKPLISTVRDLSQVFLEDMFVGFSSSTGLIKTKHVILGWSFRLKGRAPPLHLQSLPKFIESQYKRSGDTPLTSVFIPVSVPLVFMISLIFLACFILRRKRKFTEKLEDWETEFRKNRLKFKDLYYATRGFNDLLGSGGFGSVYKGVMKKKEIAVKRVSNESRQGLKEFVSEIVTIGRMSHRNLVPLLGYCRRKKELLLVYEYMPNGSLDKYLYNSSEATLNWKQRITIIKGVASALFFLHDDWEQVVIHRDIKASNVLLDVNYNGRLGDFGLARLCCHGTDLQTTHVAGTWGYLAPDLMRTGKATTATDVFAFGVLLLEVVCGRRPIEIDNESGERALLKDWVFEIWREGNIMDAKDPNLGTEYDQREVEMVLKLGLLCSHSNPQARPTMRQVLHYLSGDAMLPDLSPLDLCGSEMMLETHHELSEIGMLTGGSSMVDSVLSGGR